MKMSERIRPLISVGDDHIPDFGDGDVNKTDVLETDSLLSHEDNEVFANIESSGTGNSKDWMNMAYLILYLQGVGSLLPWNFFITARGYFIHKFKNEPSIQSSFENAFAVSAMIPNVLSLLLNVFLTNRMSRNVKLVTCIMVTLISFILTAAFVKINTYTWTSTFFAVTIVIVVLINTACAVYGGTFFGVAGIIGQKYTQALMGGQGLGGTFAAVASILSLVGNSPPEDSAFGYFLTAVFVICACMIGYFVFFKLQFVKACLARNELKAIRGSQSSDILNKPSINALTESCSSLLSITSLGSTATIPFPVREKTPYLQIFKDLSPMALSVGFTFLITLSLFPAIISGIESVNKSDGTKWTNDLFAPIVCFLIFNLGDLTGRTAAGFVQLFSPKSYWIPILCISRIIFIPLFALCNFRPNHRHGPVIFNHDAYPIVFNLLFATSNGYLGSLCMMYGPKLVSGKYAENAGTIMALFLSCGLASGAGFSFLISALV